MVRIAMNSTMRRRICTRNAPPSAFGPALVGGGAGRTGDDRHGTAERSGVVMNHAPDLAVPHEQVGGDETVPGDRFQTAHNSHVADQIARQYAMGDRHWPGIGEYFRPAAQHLFAAMDRLPSGMATENRIGRR